MSYSVRLVESKDMRRCLVLVVTLALPLLARPAHAAGSSSDKAAAEALFAEGRRLMEAGTLPEACSKFEASQRLDPGVGTMLNLAECYEKSGRTASAWAEFREVISAARAAESKEREDLARQRAAVLESKLSRLTIALSPDAAGVRGLEVRRDGTLIDSAELGSAIPVDPGKHFIEATAPGRQKWFTKIELGSDGAQLSVTVPALADVETSERAPVLESSTTVDSATKRGPSQRAFAVAAGGVGVVGLAIGTVFGLKANSNWKDAKAACTDYPYGCSPEADSKRSSARNSATLSTIGFIGGGLLLATGAVLWFTAGSHSERQTSIGVGPGSILVRGTL